MILVLGYSPEDRRRIERDAFSGNILGIVATNALELGVDIGVLDAVIMLGFPLTIASFRQQAGRAGRRAQDSLAVLVPDQFPVDQHYLQHPSDLWDTPMNELLVDLQSEVILEAHLQCASHEMPISIANDECYFGPLMKTICETKLFKDKDGWYHPHPRFLPSPSRHIHIRGAQEDKYAVVDITDPNNARILEEVEVSRALFEIYEGGVFIHQGLTFIIKQVSHDSKIAKLLRADVNWTTSPRDFTDIDAIQTHRIKQITDSPERAYFGRVNLYTKVFGFYKIRNKVILDTVDLETEAYERESTGMWIDVPRPTLDILREKEINPAEAIHSAQHAFLNQFAMAADVRTECKVPEKEYMAKESRRKRPARLIFYDIPSKGGAVAVKAFERATDLLTKACDAIVNCSCEEGCTECVLSARCKENNEVFSKLGAQLILQGVLGRDINANAVPAAESGRGFNTIVDAESVPITSGVEIEIERS
ncbi:hypothetical protein HGRIS_013454 [Hohenbuehelia grisea]|uniref:Helicase C-terminal domain-containing protein n=1 Tax=Hohenbuehelia grisea TaxID=104357 RepID=A0ABR3IVK4_9AGAR